MLTVISGTLLALFAEQLIPTLVRHGVFYGICSHKGGWTDELVVLYYVSFASMGSRGSLNKGRVLTNPAQLLDQVP